MKRWIVRISLLLTLCFSAVILGLRYFVLPMATHYKPNLERLLSAQLGQQVSIGEMIVAWRGFAPSAHFLNVQLHNALGQVVLVLPSIHASLSWSSIPAFEPRLGKLLIDGAKLEGFRDEKGHIYVAGIPVGSSEGDSPALDWLLSQGDIQIKNAEFKWTDAQAPEDSVSVKAVQFRLKNLVNFHRAGLQGQVLVGDQTMPLQAQLRFFSPLFGHSKAHMQAWRGEAFFQARDLVLQSFAKINMGLAWPVWLKNAQGQFQVWVGFDQSHIRQATLDLDMARVQIDSDEASAHFLSDVQGRLVYRHDNEALNVSVNHLRMNLGRSVLSTEHILGPWQARLQLHEWPNWQAASGRLEIEGIDLGRLSTVIQYIRLPNHLNEFFNKVNIQGQLPYLSLNWENATDWQNNFNVDATFNNISAQTVLLPNGMHLPGLSGFSGQVKGNATAGYWALYGGDGFVDMPNILKSNRIQFSNLKTQGGWQREPLNGQPGLKINWKEFAVRQGVSTFNMSGSLHFLDGNLLPVANLSGHLDAWPLQSIPAFLPVAIGADSERWLQRGLKAGVLQNGRWALQGNLQQFPFLQPKQGVFQITGQVHQADVLFDSAWPNIREIEGDARFVNGELTVIVKKAQTLKNQLSDVVLKLPILTSQPMVLSVSGQAQGALHEMLSYVRSSPLDTLLGGFLSESQASGNAKLKLAFQVPLTAPEKSQFKGELSFLDNEVGLNSEIPTIQKLRGGLEFSETGFSIKNLTGQALGGSMRVDTQTKPDKSMLLHVEGLANAAGIKRYLNLPNALKISGQTRYGVHIRFKPDISMAELNVESQLLGLGLDLPAPFMKLAAVAWPMDIRIVPTHFSKQGGVVRDEIRAQISTAASQLLTARVERDRSIQQPKITRGAVSFGEPLVMPDSGFKLAMKVDRVDLDAWQRLDFFSQSHSNLNAEDQMISQALQTKGQAFLPDQIRIKSEQLHLAGKTIDNLKLNAKRLNDRWQFELSSDQIKGGVQWIYGDKANKAGSLVMRLQHLTIPESSKLVTVDKAPSSFVDHFEMPALDIAVEQLTLGKLHLGQLRLKAVNEIRSGQNTWFLKDLEIDNEDATLKATGNWGRDRPDAARQTYLNFNLMVNNAGNLLERMGMKGVLRLGAGSVTGELSWIGMPQSFDYPTMNGKLTLNIDRGQFLKAEPGVARLLGVLSLQSIMKRLTLDFRDIFAEGFAFDQIYATADVKQGVLQTNDFKLRGTAANVLMEGQVDLVHETQNLRALILPEISAAGGSLVYSVIAANPAVGLASFLAQMVLKDPLSRVFSFEYQIGGTWDDPIVQKMDASTARK